MARTANPKNIKLSNIQIPGTDKFYPADFVEIMKLSNQENQELWPHLYGAMMKVTEVRSKAAQEKVKAREDRLKARAENVKEILTALGVTLPEGVTIRSLEVKERGPMVLVLGDDGKPAVDENGKLTNEKEQDITHYDIDLRWGVKGDATLLRKSVSTGGKGEKAKTEEVIDAEIEATKKVLVESLLKLIA